MGRLALGRPLDKAGGLAGGDKGMATFNCQSCQTKRTDEDELSSEVFKYLVVPRMPLCQLTLFTLCG